MKKTNNFIKKLFTISLLSVTLISCEREKSITAESIFEQEQESTDPLDIYLKEEFRDPYGSVIIYKFVDRYIDANRTAVPPRRDVVRPVAELIKQAWIEPYNMGSDEGEDFLKRYFPAEIVFLGSPLYNGDGTITLGTADAGVRVTLTQVNDYSPDNNDWIIQSFRTLHHEFAHIIDQNFNFDVESFYEISGEDYTSPGTWTTLISGSENSTQSINNAISRGMVTPYGTSSVAEDFAEIVSRIITTDPIEFENTYITLESCSGGDEDCFQRNIGRQRIQEKYNAVLRYMKEDVGIDLLIVRDEFLNTLN
ncbi:substrate import-associated zinc metallohydrolase lipoprotein [uncultured Aquimarina sp.]|uniref:substrate import-associated zinc metallohydrolase lipoprotein n=1 Tax=uncultured Aquimarina sp. TaxID=575652 RepID=UPI00262A6AAA|nr:substrate import-associated zinc metallohydrolase lipoprotein [uncultured Aquimarina sp.]